MYSKSPLIFSSHVQRMSPTDGFIFNDPLSLADGTFSWISKLRLMLKIQVGQQGGVMVCVFEPTVLILTTE